MPLLVMGEVAAPDPPCGSRLACGLTPHHEGCRRAYPEEARNAAASLHCPVAGMAIVMLRQAQDERELGRGGERLWSVAAP